MLPEIFQKRMESQLGDEFAAFAEALQKDAPVSLHLHLKKGKSVFEKEEKVL